MQALFRVGEVLLRQNEENQTTAQIVRLNAVYSPDPNSPNHRFWAATPAGSIEMHISNPAAFDHFRVGRAYLLTFEPVE